MLSNNEFRQLNQSQKALKLVVEYNCSHRKAATLTGLSKATITRFVKAHHDGRDIGVQGRPNILNKKEKEIVISKINDRLDNGVITKYKDIKAIVSQKTITLSRDYINNLSF